MYWNEREKIFKVFFNKYKFDSGYQVQNMVLFKFNLKSRLPHFGLDLKLNEKC